MRKIECYKWKTAHVSLNWSAVTITFAKNHKKHVFHLVSKCFYRKLSARNFITLFSPIKKKVANRTITEFCFLYSRQCVRSFGKYWLALIWKDPARFFLNYRISLVKMTLLILTVLPNFKKLPFAVVLPLLLLFSLSPLCVWWHMGTSQLHNFLWYRNVI